jgi:hypothetical protein
MSGFIFLTAACACFSKLAHAPGGGDPLDLGLHRGLAGHGGFAASSAIPLLAVRRLGVLVLLVAMKPRPAAEPATALGERQAAPPALADAAASAAFFSRRPGESQPAASKATPASTGTAHRALNRLMSGTLPPVGRRDVSISGRTSKNIRQVGFQVDPC